MTRSRLLTLAALALSAAAPAFAGWVPRVAVSRQDLFVNDVLIARVRKPLAGLNPEQRAALSAHRLRELLKSGLDPSQLKVELQHETRSTTKIRMVPKAMRKVVMKSVTRQVSSVEMRTVTETTYKTVGKGKRKRQKAIRRRVKRPVTVSRSVTTQVPTTVDYTIQVPEKYTAYYQVQIGARLLGAGNPILTASVEDAKAASKKEPGELAEAWEEALRRALKIPGLKISDDGLIVPLKEGRTVKLSGAARGDIKVSSERGDSPVAVQVDGRRGQLTFVGTRVGRDVLTLEREGATVRVDIEVQPYALTLSRPEPVVVTGSGVEPERIARLVMNRFAQCIEAQPGAKIKFEEVESVPVPGPGRTVPVAIPVSASGPGMLPVKTTLSVPVQRRSLVRQETAVLFFSNNPERVERFQTLFVGRLDRGSARLLYHHQSQLSQDAWFTAELINDGDAPAEVQVVGGDAGPVKDTVWVGYRVGSEFLSAYNADSGMVVTVPARSRLALQATRLPGGLTISGLMQLRLLSGPPPLVRIAADRPGDPSALEDILAPTPLSDASEQLLDDARRLSEHVYPRPVKQISASYKVGGNFLFLPIGRSPIAAARGDELLEGNYGVFYDFTLTLENATRQTGDVNLVFEAAGGMAGAVFEIDGRRIEIPRLGGSEEQTLMTYRMEPGTRKSVKVRTLPLSGSNYPVKLIVRS